MSLNNHQRRPYRRILILPALLTLGNFACGFFSIVICLNALFFATRAQMVEYNASKPAASAMADGIVDDGVQRTDVLAVRSSARGANARAMAMFQLACLMIFLGMVCDMLDGRVARHLGAASDFGIELDSLADLATFGIAPPVIVTTLWISVMPLSASWWGQVMIFGVVYAACAVLRLARYNIESGVADKNTFSGLPSPAAAGCVVTAVLLAQGDYAFVTAVCDWIAATIGRDLTSVQVKTRILALYLLIPGLLMVSTVPFAHLANRYLSGRKSLSILVAVLLLLVLVWHEPRVMLFLLFNGYMLLSVLEWAWKAYRARRAGTPPAAADHTTEE